MNPIVNLKWVKSHKQQKRTIYSIGKIESGLSYNLTKKLVYTDILIDPYKQSTNFDKSTL